MSEEGSTGMTSSRDEELTVRAFIVPAKRTRYLSFLASPKRRGKILDGLNHCFDIDSRFATAIKSSVDVLVEDDEDIAVNFIYNNRLVRLCCKNCVKKFKKDPAAYFKKIDAAIVKKQREHYPLETCVVGKGPLGAMGEPVEIIAGNRLVRFCCAGCKPEFEKNPAKYLAMIDAGWKAKHAKVSSGDHEKKGHDADDQDHGKGHDDHDHGDHDGS